MATKMEEKMALYTEELKKFDSNPDLALLGKIVDLLGPSIFKKDSETVACSDDAELERVEKSTVIAKLGVKGDLTKGCIDVCSDMGSSNRNKYRAIFYYLLVKKLG